MLASYYSIPLVTTRVLGSWVKNKSIRRRQRCYSYAYSERNIADNQVLGATTAEVHLSIGQRGFPDRRVFPPIRFFYIKKKRMLEAILIRWDVGSAHGTGPSKSSLPHESRRGSRHRAVVHWRLRQHHLQERHRPIRPLYRRASSCHRRQPLTRQGGRAPRCCGGSARRLDSASFRYDGTAHCQARHRNKLYRRVV